MTEKKALYPDSQTTDEEPLLNHKEWLLFAVFELPDLSNMGTKLEEVSFQGVSCYIFYKTLFTGAYTLWKAMQEILSDL